MDRKPFIRAALQRSTYAQRNLGVVVMSVKQAILFNAEFDLSADQIIGHTARLVMHSQVYPLSKAEFKSWHESNFEVEPLFAANNKEMVQRINLARDAGVRCAFFKDKLGIVVAAAIGPADEHALAAITMESVLL